MPMRPVFNVRVYGLLINERDQILVTDELRMGMKMTKFPGGGLENGEGLAAALKREFFEELKLEIDIINLFYINDFHQQSAFNSKEDLLSIYYLVSYPDWPSIPTVAQAFDFGENKDGAQVFRWMNLDQIQPSNFTFPVDKVVAQKLNSANF